MTGRAVRLASPGGLHERDDESHPLLRAGAGLLRARRALLRRHGQLLHGAERVVTAPASAATTAHVWESFSADVRRYFARRVAEPQDADDLVQEVFLRVHRHLPELRAGERVAPWVFRVARHALIDFYRRRATRDVAEPVDESLPMDEGDDASMTELVASWLEDFLPALDAADHEALRLADIDGVAQTELARRWGVSVSGAKSRVQRARRRLRELVLACCHVEFDRHGNVLGYEKRERCCETHECALECRRGE